MTQFAGRCNVHVVPRIVLFASLVAMSIWAWYSVNTRIAHADGNTYYVATNGNDANSGTSTDAPFQTISHCAQIAQAGDTCNILGGTYHETVTPANSGTSGSPITFQPYNGQNVTIDGADAVTGWSLYSGNIYRATVALPVNGYSDTGFLANQVFVDGQMMVEARWPNTGLDPLHPNNATAEAGTSNSTIVDSSLPGIDWTGATVHITGGHAWSSQTGTVTSSSSGQFSFSGANYDCSNICAGQGTKYYLTNELAALDSATEWYYDGSAQQLYLWTPAGDDPSSHTVEAKQRNYAFDLSGRSYIQIQGLNLFASSIFTDSGSSNNVIDGISANYVSHYVTIPAGASCGVYCAHNSDTGIILDGTNNILRNSTIAYSAGNDVLVAGSYNTVTNSLIHDADYSATYNAPIQVTGNNETITYNSVYNSGRDDIELGSGQNNSFSYNDVHDMGLLNQDEGGFYTCCNIDGSGTSIDHNWVHDLHADANPGAGYSGAGIYIDNGSGHFLIHHNVVWNMIGDGIRLNGYGSGYSQDNLVYNNTLGYGQNDSIGTGGTSNTDGSSVINNIFTGDDQYQDNGHNLSSSTNPLFVDASSNNYHLQSGSPAIDAGQVISGITDGYVGSAPDEGAYEYGGTDWTPGCNFTGCTTQTGGGGTGGGTNYVQNPGFETGDFSSWCNGNGAYCANNTITSSNVHSGSYAAQLGGAGSDLEQWVGGLSPNTTYTVSGWGAVATAGEQVLIGVKLTGGTEGNQPITRTSYTQVSVTFTTGSSNTTAKIYLYKNTGSGNAYGDDFSVVSS